MTSKTEQQDIQNTTNPTQRVYFDIQEMRKAGMSKEQILEKIKETFRQKGMLKK